MKSEHTKLILVAGLLVAAGGTFFLFGRSKGPLPNSVDYACVATGEIFSIAQEDLPNVVPAKNPKTGQRTLLPLAKATGPKRFVSRHYAGSLVNDPQLAEVNKYVDPKTLEVLLSPR